MGGRDGHLFLLRHPISQDTSDAQVLHTEVQDECVSRSQTEPAARRRRAGSLRVARFCLRLCGGVAGEAARDSRAADAADSARAWTRDHSAAGLRTVVSGWWLVAGAFWQKAHSTNYQLPTKKGALLRAPFRGGDATN